MKKRLVRLLERLFAAFAAIVLRPFVHRATLGSRSEAPKNGAPRRVLVLRVDERVGNVLLTTPLVTRLIESLPESEIHVLVAASKRGLLVPSIHAIPFEKKSFFKRPLAFWRSILALRAARYDVAIDASHWHDFSLTSALLLLLTGAPRRIAHDRGDAARFATDLVPPPSRPEPEIDTKLRLLGPLGVPTHVLPMSTALGTALPPALSGWLAEHAGPRVGIAPGARKLDHRLAPSLFRAAIAAATGAGARSIILWGPGEESLARDVAAGTTASIAPPTNLDELAALMRACAVVVANDTGPMHLSVAVGTPTIALFSKDDHARWGHSAPPHTVVVARERPEEEIARDVALAVERALSRSD